MTSLQVGELPLLHSSGFGINRKRMSSPEELALFDVDHSTAPRDLNGGTILPVSAKLYSRMIDMGVVTPSTTSCETCHRLSGLSKKGNDFQFNNSSEFHLLGWGQFGQVLSNVRTLAELDLTVARIASEIFATELSEKKYSKSRTGKCHKDIFKAMEISDCLEGGHDPVTCFAACPL